MNQRTCTELGSGYLGALVADFEKRWRTMEETAAGVAAKAAEAKAAAEAKTAEPPKGPPV